MAKSKNKNEGHFEINKTTKRATNKNEGQFEINKTTKWAKNKNEWRFAMKGAAITVMISSPATLELPE